LELTLQPIPYPADTKAKGWRFELDLERVMQSDTWALATPDVRPWLLMLWTTAWLQIPCGSMPSDDALLAARLGMPAKTFQKHKAVLLRGWWLAEDGRFYNDTIVERVCEMMDVRGVDRARQEARRNLFERIRERDEHACVYCGHTKYLTLDHILPLSRGGNNDELNLAIACRPCNSKKNAKTPEESGMQFLKPESEERWRNYKNSAGEKRSKTEQKRETQMDDTGTGTGTGTGLTSKEQGSSRHRASDDKPQSPAEWIEVFADQHGVDVDHRSFHDRKKFWPLAQAWTNAGITVGQMREACAKAHADSTEAIAWLPAYADRVLATIAAQKAPQPEQEWQTEARKRMQIANPRLAVSGHSTSEIIDAEVKNVAAIGLD
jgi:hypothetical protein